MDPDQLKSITRPRKLVEVYYVPDTLISCIIPNESIKENGPKKFYNFNSVNDYIVSNQHSPDKLRKTRSGRPIVNKFRQLSLNDSPEKQISDTTEPDSEADLEKPNEYLFDGEENNQAIYSFRTPKRQNGMVAKATESVKSHGTPVTPVTRKSVSNGTPGTPQNRAHPRPSKALYCPRSGRIRTKEDELRNGTHHRDPQNKPQDLTPPPKTPYGLRNRIRKRLVDEAAKQELDRLLEDSESDFVPSSSSDSESESTDSESDSSSNAGSDPPSLGYRGDPGVRSSSTSRINPLPNKMKSKKMKDYVFQSDEYFYRQYSKIMTSNNKLSKLKTPKMAHNKLSSILKNVEKKHVQSYERIESNIEKSFRRWLFAFSEGFNVMLYGLGSKIHILQNFRSKWLKNSNIFYVNGYFPDNSMKEILNGILSSCLEETTVPSQPHEMLDLIKKVMALKNTPRLYILITNLDGKFIQNEKSQSHMSQLASIPKIHFLATIDHINSPLLWDQSKLSKFNFIWEDATNFYPYTEETSYESSLMVQWSGGVALSSIKNVFSSLTFNSRKVFKILINHHLENHGPKYSGMHFSDLYRECRAGFVVSSDLALRTLLTEFMDHQLVKWRKETDHLLITVETPILKQFLGEIDYLD